jgi:nicotinate-nucleotide pyrophosphorylase (carboxylating)
MTGLDPAYVRAFVRRALSEDVGSGDVTTSATVPDDCFATAALVSQSDCVVAGIDIAAAVFREVDAGTICTPVVADGARARRGDRLAEIRGHAAAILTAERTALNVLQHLSGIATLTRRFVDAAAGRIQILDTRKTVPTLRALAKYAVRCGGGVNHRAGLYDAVLIKENHARIAGGLTPAIRRARARWPDRPIEAEAQSLDDVAAAVAAGADVVMLDNLTEDEMRDAIRTIAGRARVEISGGVTLDRIPGLAALGADMVSVGALTHSAPAVDISLDFDPDRGATS